MKEKMRIKIPRVYIVLYNYFKRIEEVILTFFVISLRPFRRSRKRVSKDACTIIHYTECLWYGGVVKVIQRLVPYFKGKGYRQVLICRSDQDNLRGFSGEFSAYHIGKFTLINADLATTNIYFSFSKIMKLSALFKTQKTDILIIHKANAYRDRLALLAGQLAGVSLILNYEMCGDIPAQDRYQNWLKRVRDNHVPDKLIAMSPDIQSILCDDFGLNGDNIVCVPNFVDLKEFVCLKDDVVTFRRKYGLAQEGLFLGVAGRLVAAKGQAYLLGAITMIRPRHPQVKILFSGDGPNRKALAEKSRQLGIEENVRFLGFLERRELIALYKVLFVGILPSLSEGMPGVILEYMASGLPVVATSVGGNKDLITDGVNGFLVFPRDPAALAEAINKLLDDPVKAKKMGEAGRRRVGEEFTVEKAGEKIEEQFKNLKV